MGSFNVALLEALLAIGVPPERARNVVDLFDRSVDERYGLHAQVLATKRDVAKVETHLAELETRLTREIAENRTKIAESRSDVIKWVLAAMTAQTALLVGALRLF